MDNYRRPMYTRYNRNMGSYQNPQSGCGVTPVMEAGHREITPPAYPYLHEYIKLQLTYKNLHLFIPLHQRLPY